jgi:hypothetical protein
MPLFSLAALHYNTDPADDVYPDSHGGKRKTHGTEERILMMNLGKQDNPGGTQGKTDYHDSKTLCEIKGSDGTLHETPFWKV